MTEVAASSAELRRREWWEERRGSFSGAVLAGYAAAVVVWELLTPSWAGDHGGLSPSSLIFLYGPGALFVLAAANVVYWLPRLIEPKDLARVDAFRRRAFRTCVVGGAAFYPAWIGLGLFEAWLRHRS